MNVCRFLIRFDFPFEAGTESHKLIRYLYLIYLIKIERTQLSVSPQRCHKLLLEVANRSPAIKKIVLNQSNLAKKSPFSLRKPNLDPKWPPQSNVRQHHHLGSEIKLY